PREPAGGQGSTALAQPVPDLRRVRSAHVLSALRARVLRASAEAISEGGTRRGTDGDTRVVPLADLKAEIERRSPLSVERIDDEPDVDEPVDDEDSAVDTVLDAGLDAADEEAPQSEPAAAASDASRGRRSHRRRGRRGGRRSRPGGDPQ